MEYYELQYVGEGPILVLFRMELPLQLVPTVAIISN